MKKIYYNSYPSFEAEKRDPLFKKMCTSGFLQSTGDSAQFLHNDYSFLHLTFQEFFAARYLARLLQDNRKEAAKCIQEVKFNPRYKVVMWFTAGLLKDEGSDFPNLNAFFEMLDTPKDLVGLYGTLLKVRCLEECGWQKKLQKLMLYEDEIGFWLKKACSIHEYSTLLEYLIETFEISPYGTKRLFIPKFNSSLSNDNVDDRRFALTAFRTLGHADLKAVIPTLLKALKNGDFDVRNTIGRLLGHANPQEVIPELIEIFKDKKPLIRRAVIKILGGLDQADPKVVIPILFKALKDKDDFVRETGAIALGNIGQKEPKAVIPALIDAIYDQESRVRAAVAKALGHVGVANPEAVIPTLLDILNDKEDAVRAAVVEALGHIGVANPEAVIPTLLVAINDKEVWVNQTAKKALVKVGYNLVVSPFGVSKEEGSEVKDAVAKKLDQLDHSNRQALIPTLLDSLKNGNYQTRASAAMFLGQIGDADLDAVMPALLITLTNDEGYDVRRTAVNALGKLGLLAPKTAIPALVKTLKDDKDHYIKCAAADALGEIGHVDFKVVIPALIETFKDDRLAVKPAVIRAMIQLSKIDPHALIPPLVANLNEKDKRIRNGAVEILGLIVHADPEVIIPFLLESLKDKDSRTRVTAVNAIGNIGHINSEAAIPALFETLKDEANNVRDAAIKVLQKFDLSLYLKSHPNMLMLADTYGSLLTATPLSSLLICYKKDHPSSSIYSTAIAKKCIAENLSIFQLNSNVCYYEQGKLCTIDLADASLFISQIEKQVSEYPNFDFSKTEESIAPIIVLESNNEVANLPVLHVEEIAKPPTTQDQQKKQSKKKNNESCSLQ